MKKVIDQVWDVIRQVDPILVKKCNAGVDPSDISSKQGPEVPEASLIQPHPAA